jgi:hypothetical protein
VPTALITGPVQHASDTALALKTAGFEVVAAEPDPAQFPPSLPQIDCYVQLPLDPPWGRDDALTWARSVVTSALLARFDAAARVAPMLAPRARVLLVADPTGGNPAFGMDVVRLLVQAIIADRGGRDVQVTVMDGLRPSEEISAAVRPRRPAWTAYRTIGPDLAFSDWRNEIICQSSIEQ